MQLLTVTVDETSFLCFQLFVSTLRTVLLTCTLDTLAPLPLLAPPRSTPIHAEGDACFFQESYVTSFIHEWVTGNRLQN